MIVSMELTFLGTSAGTEPMPNRRHTAFVLRHEGSLYWFDAGEGCSRTAHLMGLDLTKVRAVFVSHTHMDHVGGLGNLLWTIRKIHTVDYLPERRDPTQPLDIFVPNMRSWEGLFTLLQETEDGFHCDFPVQPHRISDGLLFADDNLTVTAHHNNHLKQDPEQGFLSYSFRIESAGASVVYSGDVAQPSDVEPLLSGGCGLLLMETGHHSVEDVCYWVREQRNLIETLGLLHHGPHVQADISRADRVACSILGRKVLITEDGMNVSVRPGARLTVHNRGAYLLSKS